MGQMIDGNWSIFDQFTQRRLPSQTPNIRKIKQIQNQQNGREVDTVHLNETISLDVEELF